MSLLDRFYQKSTRISIFLAPIGLTKLAELPKISENDFGSNSLDGEISAINYTFGANYFSGQYNILFDSRDNGFKPILLPCEKISSREVIQAEIIFPTEIKKSTEHGFSQYSPSKQDWNPPSRIHPLIFCSVPIEDKQFSARLYFESKENKTLSQTISMNREHVVRKHFTCKMYDLELVNSQDRFSLKEWEV